MPASRRDGGGAHAARSLSLWLALGAAACQPAPPLPPVPQPPAPASSSPAPASPAAAAARTLEIGIKPVLDGGEVGRLENGLSFSEPPGEHGAKRPLELTMAEREEGEGGWPAAIDGVSAHDAEGALALRAESTTVDDDPEIAWRSDRPPVGAVTLSYRVKVSRADASASSGTRAHAGGFEGTGGTFVLLPQIAGAYHVRVVWDLSGLGGGAHALSSFGAGIRTETLATMDRIRGAVFTAGPIGRLSIDHAGARFEGAWLGEPGFDPLEALPWAARVRTQQRVFFRDADPEPFAFFLRVVPKLGPTWVGSGKTASFVLLVGEGFRFTRKARFAIAHELVHHWIGSGDGVRFDGPEGSAYWFTEGFTVHYTRTLLLRDGLCTPEEFADDLRERTERHVTSPERSAPNAEIVKRFWKSHDVEKLPYDRGMLYAADVDAAVRARSGGKRSLDDLVLGLVEKARAGALEGGGTARLPAATWRELVGAELGPEAQARFDAAIVRGEPITPPSNAYGPCFKAEKRRVPRFELGFDVKSFDANKIVGLVRGSAADRAGVREGDVLTKFRSAFGIAEPVELTVKRGDAEKKVSFLPRGAGVEGTIWVRDPKVPASACARW